MTFFLDGSLHQKCLLAALEDAESAGGRDVLPRLEVSYMPEGFRTWLQGREYIGTGSNFTAVAELRWNHFGVPTACSYGPWQILYHRAADLGFYGYPWVLIGRDISEKWALANLKRAVHQGAKDVADFARFWNGGHIHSKHVPDSYVQKVKRSFARHWGEGVAR